MNEKQGMKHVKKKSRAEEQLKSGHQNQSPVPGVAGSLCSEAIRLPEK